MPDVFVSLDTSESSSYFTKLIYSNAMREFTLNYKQKNKKKLEKMSFDEFNENFDVDKAMLDELIKTAENVEVPFDEIGFNRSKNLIKLRAKAEIAKGIWGNEYFYPVINQSNEILQEALTLFEQAEKLANNY